MLIAVPNLSEGRDLGVLAAVREAYARAGARVLDVHADPDHHRSVFTLAGEPGRLGSALARGVQAALENGVDVSRHPGLHPHVGAVDVVPVVYLDDETRGAACAEALVAAHEIGDRGVPVLLYGLLGGGRTRAELRRGGPAQLSRRLRDAELTTDFGPCRPHPTAGTTLVAARPPLLAFNVELEPTATEEDAKRIAALIREGGADGLHGVRAIGLTLADRGHVAQVSTNVEDHRRTTLAQVVAAVQRHARVTEAEVVGLPPQAAFAGFPADVPVRNRRSLEQALAAEDF